VNHEDPQEVSRGARGEGREDGRAAGGAKGEGDKAVGGVGGEREEGVIWILVGVCLLWVVYGEW
jgi:hypothetical protein